MHTFYMSASQMVMSRIRKAGRLITELICVSKFLDPHTLYGLYF
jgi:hypothetical protein